MAFPLGFMWNWKTHSCEMDRNSLYTRRTLHSRWRITYQNDTVKLPRNDHFLYQLM